MGEDFSEEQRANHLASLQAAHPEVDITALAAGSLAGPPSPDRPAVPVWMYLDYLTEHPDLTIEELSTVRFPVALHTGTTLVTSIAELLASGPRTPTYSAEPEDIVELYRLMHEAGALVWNPETRTHEEVQPADSYKRPVYERWRIYLQNKNAT